MGSTFYLGTGIGDLDAAKKYLRRKFNQGMPEPIQTRPGARFYVTAKLGSKTAPLLGPYVSHMTALAAVGRGERLMRDKYPTESGFATVGTCSSLKTVRTAFGR